MKNVRASLAYWITGTVIAICGVILARWIAPLAVDRLRLYATLGGQLLALGGLVIISVGVSRRLQKGQETSEA